MCRHPGRKTRQLWFTCDQCNAEWHEQQNIWNEQGKPYILDDAVSSGEGLLTVNRPLISINPTAKLLKFCQICRTRCHKLHRGVREVHSSVMVCECHTVSTLLCGTHCVALERVPRQIELQRVSNYRCRNGL